MLKWPQKAQSAIRKFFEPLQDIDVYIEDSNDEVFYRCLLKYACGDKVKVARVFSLGGRRAVEAAAMTHNHKNRRALFIVDGDLPWVRGDASPIIQGLHRHDAYCIENLLFCEKALGLVFAQEAVLTEANAHATLDYAAWKNSISEPLLKLFAAFATVNHFDPTVPTVSKGVGVLCKKTANGTVLDSTKVQQKIEDSIQCASAKIVTQAAASDFFDKILERIKLLKDPLNAVSGKDFLLPLIDFHLQTLGCRIRRKSLRVRLAAAGDRTRFDSLAKSLEKAAAGF